MCEIMFMLKTNGKPITKTELKNFLLSGIKSGEDNKDGYGVMCEDWFLKNPSQMDIKSVENILSYYKEDSRFFALHTRLATCEVKEEYTHPFDLNTFLGMHNGVISTDEINTGSDSLDLFKTIEKQPEKEIKQKIIIGMSKINGSYSVLIYSKIGKNLYYFRNSCNFDFLLNEENNIIYGGTKINRLIPLTPKKYGFFDTGVIKTPEKNILYKLDLKNGYISNIGVIKEKPEIEKNYHYEYKNKGYKYKYKKFKDYDNW
jgi:hypothetical protein